MFLLFKYAIMSFWPKKKHSKSRSKTRTSNWLQLTAKKLKNRVSLNKENNGLSHFVAEDWTYNGRQVIKIKSKAKSVTRV